MLRLPRFPISGKRPVDRSHLEDETGRELVEIVVEIDAACEWFVGRQGCPFEHDEGLAAGACGGGKSGEEGFEGGEGTGVFYFVGGEGERVEWGRGVERV